MSNNPIHDELRDFENKIRTYSDPGVEAVIRRDDLFPKITELVNDGPVSLWTLFEKLATPLDVEQSAVLYAVEELWGMGHIEHASEEHLTQFVTTHGDVAPVGSPAWLRERLDVTA